MAILRFVGKYLACHSCHSLLKHVYLDEYWFIRCPVCGWTFKASDIPPANPMDFLKAIIKKFLPKQYKSKEE